MYVLNIYCLCFSIQWSFSKRWQYGIELDLYVSLLAKFTANFCGFLILCVLFLYVSDTGNSFWCFSVGCILH